MWKSLLLAASLGLAAAQPFLPGQTPAVLPLGNLRTTDGGRPGGYNLSLLVTQYNEIEAGIAARQNFTDSDIIDFLTNVECLEGLFDTWGVFGQGFINNAELGGPTPIGVRAANLTEQTRPFLEEVALNEQGHALFVRQAGGVLPCPQVDITNGFNSLLAAAYGIVAAPGQSAAQAIAAQYGASFDPFLNDQNFVLSVLSLEELGATGNKGLIGLLSNPVLANGVAGLATSATAQATIERKLLWELRSSIIQPFNETAAQAFARISAIRDALDGQQVDDQGIYNTDPRTIAVPDNYVNMIPTDIRGLTFSRTPQQVINIVTLGAANSRGGFFPGGLLGAINSSTGYNLTGNGTAAFPTTPGLASQASVAAIGTLLGPITPGGPANVTGEYDLTQSLSGPADNGTYTTRGYVLPAANGTANTANTSLAPQVGTAGGVLPAYAIPGATAPAPAPTASLAEPVVGASAAGRK